MDKFPSVSLFFDLARPFHSHVYRFRAKKECQLNDLDHW